MVFCDFDGTITREDTLQAMSRRFAPSVADRLLADIGEGRISLRSGLEALIGSLPSARAEEIADFVREQPVREGFGEFLRYLRASGTPVVVLSSNLRLCVEARLGEWRPYLHDVHALDVDLQQAYMRPIIDHRDTREALPKADIMLQYPVETRIVIGDSLSDRSMALHAQRVFARDRLLDFVRGRGMAATPYATFHDIIAAFSANGPASAATA